MPRLRGTFGRPYVFAPVCESTQRLLDEDAPEGAIAVTDEQTAGRGRLGRRWYARPGTSVLCSIVLRPAVPPPRLPELSLVAGHAVAEAVEQVTAIACELKFPNDVLIGGEKVAGILAEAREGRVVLGVGVNVNATETELPTDVETPATSLMLQLGRAVDRCELLVAILDRLERGYSAWVRSTR